MYQTLNPNVETLWQALTQFNLPFNFAKEVLVSAITFLVYKKLSPILHGRKN
jgi:riboflavin transporter FmnP